MKAEITINSPVLTAEKMEDYLRLFAKMLLIAEGETIAELTVNGKEVNPYRS